jgi:hypothetical protein
MDRRSEARRIATYIVAYGAWILSWPLAVAVILLLRGVINSVYVLARLPAAAHHYVDYTVLFIVGSVLIVTVIGFESYFRDGAARGDLMRRIARVFGLGLLLGAVLFLAFLLTTWLQAQ